MAILNDGSDASAAILAGIAGVLPFTQAGSGAVNRAIHQKAGERVSVLDFIDPDEHAGILAGTSTHDCTAGFDAAIATGKSVFVPKGAYEVDGISVVGGMELAGERGAMLVVRSNNSAAFLHAAETNLYDIRISRLAIKAKAGVTGARGYKHASKAVYTAYACFMDIETYQDLEVSYDGFFIFHDWYRCRDGYLGSAVGGQTHQAINSIPDAYGQALQSNLNQVRKCQFFRSTNADGAVNVAYGARWEFSDSDFETLTTQAVNALGVFGLSFNGCWFEGVNASDIITVGTSPEPNAQRTRPVDIANCFVYCHANNTRFLNAGATISAGLRNIAFSTVPSGMVLTNATSLYCLHGIEPLSGSYTNFLAGISVVHRPASSATPAANGDLVIEATSNTSLTFKLKGTDGTVRSGSVTLS